MKRFVSLFLAFISLFLCAFDCGKDWHYGHFYFKNTTDQTILLHIKRYSPRSESDYKIDPGDMVEFGTVKNHYITTYAITAFWGIDITMCLEDGTRLRRWCDEPLDADNIPTDKETALEECYVPFFKEYNIRNICNNDDWITTIENGDTYKIFEIRPEDLIPIPEIIAEKDNDNKQEEQ
ncbi:MAG: hypothetical protein PUC72_01140 [Bacteroidales bacterium]|nr:hypothetical protein [Bacteroidales bacterium]